MSLGVFELDPDGPLDDLAGSYVEVREMLRAAAAAFKEQEAAYKDCLSTVEAILLERLNAMGNVGSVRTNAGTITRKTVNKFFIEDAQQFHQAILESGNLHWLEQRVSSRAMNELAEVSVASLPAGIRLNSEHVISITSPRK